MIAILCNVIKPNGQPGLAWRCQAIAHKPVEYRDPPVDVNGALEIQPLYTPIKIHLVH